MDPSRPRLGFQFLIRNKELSSEIGQVFSPESEFRVGDIVIGIEGEPWDPDVDGDLEDNLRIYQAQVINLDVIRSGSPIRIPFQNVRLVRYMNGNGSTSAALLLLRLSIRIPLIETMVLDKKLFEFSLWMTAMMM